MGNLPVRVFRGPSIYSRTPVIRYTLEPVAAEPESERLFELLPGMRQRYAACDIAGSIPHFFEHVVLELHGLTGVELHCVRSQGAGIPDRAPVVAYDNEDVGLEAGRLALELMEPSASVDFERRLRAFLRFAERHRLPVQDRAVVQAAEARDIPVLPIAGRLLQLGHGRHQQRMSATETTRTSILGNDLAANKDYARRMCRAVGLPVPAYERVYRERDAVAAAERIGYPVVVKPNSRNMGVGVSVGMKTRREVREAFRQALPLGRSVLVEAFVPGSDYRMLVIDGTLRAAAKRVPAHVVGDGTHTIADLVVRANEDPRRGAGQRRSWTRLTLDEGADRLLAERGYGRDAVPVQGEAVYLRRIANTSAGGTAIDVTDEVHPENREIAERAARAIGLDIAGVDLLVEDITQPLRAQGGVICEINSRPGIRKHLWPAEGQPRDVIGPILDMLFPPGSRTRIPIAVVTGNGDTTGVARMLADVLAADGSSVGLATHDGVFIGGRRADGGGMDAWSATRLLLLDPGVDVAILALPAQDVLEHGLGYDRADACAVVNDRPIDSPDLVQALRLVVSSARAHVVMSAEDEARYELRPPAGARVERDVTALAALPLHLVS